MPFDSTPIIKTRQAEPTLSHFAAWLETRDPSESYCFMDMKDCAILRCERSTGLFHGALHSAAYDEGWMSIANAYPMTMGGALERARKALSLKPRHDPNPNPRHRSLYRGSLNGYG